MVDALDEPIGDPAAINTLLMCEAARERGVKVILSGMGADELFGGYRKHLACVMAGRYHRLPGTARAGAALRGGPGSRSASTGRGLRYARLAKRFLTFAELPEEPRFRRSYTLYDADELAALVSPDLAGYVDQVIDGHSDIYNDNSLPDEVNRMCLADSRLFLPGLNLAYTRPGEHGGLRRGTRPVRRPRRGPRGVLDQGQRQDLRPAGQGRAQAGRGELAAAARSCTGRRLPSAPPCGPGCATTCSRSSTTCWSEAS